MNLRLRRTFAASAAALVLAGAACSNDIEGKASPNSTSASSKTDSSESSAPTTSQSQKTDKNSGGTQTSSDGSFTYELPDGYEDAASQIKIPNAVVVAVDPSTGANPTRITAVTSSSQGLSVDAIGDVIIKQLEGSLNTTFTKSSKFPLSDVDGEDVIAYTTDSYEQAGQKLASAVVITTHNGEAYLFIVDTNPDNTSDAGDSLVSFIESVKWA